MKDQKAKSAKFKFAPKNVQYEEGLRRTPKHPKQKLFTDIVDEEQEIIEELEDLIKEKNNDESESYHPKTDRSDNSCK